MSLSKHQKVLIKKKKQLPDGLLIIFVTSQ